MLVTQVILQLSVPDSRDSPGCFHLDFVDSVLRARRRLEFQDLVTVIAQCPLECRQSCRITEIAKGFNDVTGYIPSDVPMVFEIGDKGLDSSPIYTVTKQSPPAQSQRHEQGE
jgi:hypothetical protein